MKPGISIVVPALNEAANLRAAVDRASRAARRHFPEHEIIIVDDGSTDATGRIAEDLALADPRIRVIHHERPRNLGYAYKAGVALAQYEYVLMFPGDNEGTDEQLDAVMAKAGQADIITNYVSNPEVRTWSRRVVSWTFVALMNRRCGRRLRYYNGTVLHRTELVRSIRIHTDSFAYQAEALVKLLSAGRTYLEVPTPITMRAAGRTKAFRLKNLVGVGRALLRLYVRR